MSRTDGFAVPTSNSRYSWRESALTTLMSASRDNHVATAVFPAAVGPQMTRIASLLLSAKATLELGPGQLHDRGASMHVVCGQRRVAQCNEQRTHLTQGQLVACLHRGLARNGGCQAFVLRVRTADAIAGK